MFSTGPTKHDKLNAVIARYRGQLTDKQTKFLSDYYPRYKGSIGDREYKVLGELGYEGSLNDRWNAYMRDLGGKGRESLDVLYKTFYGAAGYHENDKDPQLVVDTVNEFYRKDGEGTKGPLEKATLFNHVVTHNSSTAGNATMVDSTGKIKWRPHNLLQYSEDLTSIKYVDFGSTGNVTFVDATTITFAGGGAANAANKTLDSTNLVGQQITGAIELSSQTHAGEKVQIRLNWRGGTQVYGDVYTLTTTPTFVYVTGTVPAGTTGVDLIVASPAAEQVDKTFTATKWHVYRSDLGGMADVPASERVLSDANTYVRTAGREVSGIELVENGTFDTDYTNWTNYNGGTISVSNGELNISTDPTIPNTGVYQQFDTIVGRVYQVSGDVTSVDSTPRLLIGNGIGSGLYVNLSHNNHGETKTLSGTFVAVSTTTYISLQTAPVSSQSKYDNISVKEIDVDPAAARYLPRIGHHVYNGSQWVNEGLLHESGSRANIVPYSEDLSNSAWDKQSCSVAAADDAFGLKMWTITDSSSSAFGLLIDYFTIPDQTQFTISLFVKKNDSPTSQFSVRVRASNGSIVKYIGDSINVDDGTADGGMWEGDRNNTFVEDWGTHWKLNVTGTLPAGYTQGQGIELFPAHNDTSGAGSSANTGSHVVGGIQVETGSTPSSYIPTSGSTVTRAAETLTIEHENLPWSSSAVSIAMEGRMTYTDNEANSEFSFYDWFIASNDYLRTYFQTNGGTGKITASQNDAGTFDGKSTGGSDFSPDVLVPYSFAVRHGSNFINMSADGESLVVNTTPVNLPDASSTDIRIGKGAANDYIGTIRSFRIWANDIGDDGIIEASEPELQPTLSLSFDGTESSFIDFEWSE